MSEQLQLRRNVATSLGSFLGQVGECVVDTTNNRICVNDFATPGGWPAAKLSEVQATNRHAVADANYTLTAPVWGTPWVSMVSYTALTAARTVTLPAAASYPAGTRLLIIDEAGLCTPALTISVQPAGTDTINGNTSSTPVVLNQRFAYVAVESNGVNAWVITDSYYGQTGYRMALSPNGASFIVTIAEIVANITSITTTLTAAIPANAMVFACAARVTVALTTGVIFEIGTPGNLGQFGLGLAAGAGTTSLGVIGPTVFYSATNIVITATTGTPATGTVRLALMYVMVGAPSQ